jgi:MoaA/NifB/PqqE/SkfB family radical SAM enzyme
LADQAIFLALRTVINSVSNFIKNHGQLKFAVVQVTTRCNAKCLDRCNIWALKPFDVSLQDVKFAIDVLAKNNFSFVYFTGGETGLYPYLVEAVEYAKKKSLITSITTNGTIPNSALRQMRSSLDVLSVSVDHYNERLWSEAKHVAGISEKAKETIRTAKECGIKLYGITFLNPAWSMDGVERVIRYVNEDLGIPFAMSYPFVSSSEGGTFVVDGKLRDTQLLQSHVRDMVAKVLQMKIEGSVVATASSYLRDVLRAHDGLPMKYPCKAGEIMVTIDCDLNVFPCYKRGKLFNLRERQDLNLFVRSNLSCDNKYCLINCFKESSLASQKTLIRAVREELFSNPKFYMELIEKRHKRSG